MNKGTRVLGYVVLILGCVGLVLILPDLVYHFTNPREMRTEVIYNAYIPRDYSLEESISFSNVIDVSSENYPAYSTGDTNYLDLSRLFHKAQIDYYVKGNDGIWRHMRLNLNAKPFKRSDLTMGFYLPPDNISWSDLTIGDDTITVMAHYESESANFLVYIVTILAVFSWLVAIVYVFDL